MSSSMESVGRCHSVSSSASLRGINAPIQDMRTTQLSSIALGQIVLMALDLFFTSSFCVYG